MDIPETLTNSNGASVNHGIAEGLNGADSALASLRDRQMRALFEAALDAMVIADDEGRYIDANPAACELFGLSREELLGQRISDFAAPEMNVPHAWEEFQRLGQMKGEFRLRRRDGSMRDVEYAATANFLPHRHLSILRDITDRKTAEAEIRRLTQVLEQQDRVAPSFHGNGQSRGWSGESLYDYEQRLDSILDSIGGTIWSVTGDQSRIVYVNPSIEKIYHRSAAAFLADPQLWLKVIHPEDQNRVKIELGNGLKAGRYQLKYRILRPDGEVRWIQEQVQVVWDRDRKPLRIDGFTLDVTEHHGLEAELQTSQQKYRTLFEILPIGLAITDAEGQVIEANPASEQILGFSLTDRASLPCGQYEWPIIRSDGTPMPSTECAGVQALVQNQVVRNVLKGVMRPDGSTVWLNVTAAPIPLPDYGVAIAYIDVTQHKQAEAHLQLQSAALEACANGIVITDQKGQIEWVNPAFTELTGYTLEEARGKNPRDLVKSGQHSTEFFQQLWTTILMGKVWHGEIVNRRKDGSLYSEEMTITPLMDAQGEIQHFIAIKQDISDRKQVEAALSNSETFFRTIFEDAEIGIAVCSATTGKISLCNSFFLELLGYDRDEVAELDWKAFTHEADWAVEETLILECIEGVRDHYQIEKRYIRKDGVLRWVSLNASIIRDEAGQIQFGFTMVKDITEQRVALQQRELAEMALRQQAEREHLIAAMSERIRRSLDASTILNTAVAEVRQFLKTDRVLIYHLNSDQSGTVIAESVGEGWVSLLGRTITDTCFTSEQCILPYTQGHIQNVSDIYDQRLPDCYVNLLAEFQVRGNLVLPILQADRVWGLLIAQHCETTRLWQPDDVNLLRQLADQVAIAIQQAELYQQVQHLNATLELQVQERTAQLAQSLAFEALLKRITDNVRDSLDEQQILQTVVQELASGLNIECCNTGIYNAEQTLSTVYAESTTQLLLKMQGCNLKLVGTPYLDIYQDYLLKGQVCQFCEVAFNPIRPDAQQKFTLLACPIFVGEGQTSANGSLNAAKQEVLGDLWLFKSAEEAFSEQEVRLVQQVATQCAIALRQSRLYQAAQAQVKELERLNQLKDDFLSTVSHELRSPMATIKMAVQMLELMLDILDLEPSDIETKEIILRQPKAAKAIEYFQILDKECSREINLINDLLDLARLDAGTVPIIPTEVALQAWIPHIAEAFIERSRQQQQQLQMQVPDELPSLSTDLASLERILIELLHNACKYTPAGGTITASAVLINSPHSETPSAVQITISNSGVEIPPDEWKRVFDKFYRIPNNDPWKHGGTGLGLALVKKLVDRLQGQITAHSSPGQTHLVLVLPLVLDSHHLFSGTAQ